ncbi:MAG: DEAD/DEAH box helicase [Candidatus Latescibacterota bacterium]
MPTGLQAQIERRRQRAQAEIVRVANKGAHPVFSTFEVTSTSGRPYRVQIRSLDKLHNTCACPDYQTNLIGTCKHIEGVLHWLRKQHGGRLGSLARAQPAGAQVYLRYGEEVEVRVSQPLPRPPAVRACLSRFFDVEGVLLGAPQETLPPLLAALEALAPREHRLVSVDEAVREYLELLQDREAVQKQKDWFLEQVRAGRRSLGVLAARLYPYQEEGALHLAFGRRAMLADDMGLGKTVQAIAAAALLKELRGTERVLVVTPASLKHQWAREIRRFTSLPVTVIEGGLLARRDGYRAGSFFTVLNYELVRRDLDELEKVCPQLVILDEAQRIKNWRSKTAIAVKRLQSRYAFVLTGTPLENRLDELYSIFQFMDPRILGPLWRFNERFFELAERPDGSYKVLGYRNLGELRATIAPYSLRRTRDEVLRDLPERIDNNFFVEMTDGQWQAYNEYREIVAQLAARAQRRPLTPQEKDRLLKGLLKMRLICNALALHDKDILAKDREKTAPKLRELEHVLRDEVAQNGHKAVVFSQWSGMLALTGPLMKRLGLGHVTLTGDVPTRQRGGLIERFFDDRDCRVFLSTDAGGLGLNLQAASLVVNLDLPWNPAVLEQRIGRAHRHGQQQPVHVVNLIAQGTIEERMLDTLKAKRSVFAGVFGTEEAPAHISFQDAGQGLLKRLDELLGPAPQVELEPEATATPGEDVETRETERISTQPGAAAGLHRGATLKGLADLLLARLPARLLLVGKAPVGTGVLVVVERDPAGLRPQIESTLAEYFGPEAPALHVMEPEGYRALTALLPATAADEPAPYRSPALPAAAGEAGGAARQRRLQKAREGLDFAAQRLALAEVVLKGGFPEEMLRPIREALGWALTACLALYGDCEPSGDLPAARLIQADLVEPGHLPDALAARLARVRELTEPASDGQAAPPPSLRAGEALAAAVRELVELGKQRAVEVSL